MWKRGMTVTETIAKTIGKIHDLDLRLKACGSGVGRSLDHRSQAVSLIIAGPGHRGCYVLHPEVWISLERQTGSTPCAISYSIIVTAWRAVSRTPTPRCHLQSSPGRTPAQLSAYDSSLPLLAPWFGERKHVTVSSVPYWSHY